MIELETAISFFCASILLGFAPGPDIVFVLTQSAVHGTRAGLATMCGLLTGLCFHTTLVSVGVAAIILASPLAFQVVLFCGAAYLLYLAWLSWRAGAMRAGGEKPPFAGYAALYRRGIIMNVTNPKVTVFFLAMLPQFCKPELGSAGLQCFQLGLIFMLGTLTAFGTTSVLAGKIFSRFNQSDRAQIILNKACAAIFVTMALLLIFA